MGAQMDEGACAHKVASYMKQVGGAKAKNTFTRLITF
jgi:hypothetical protein